MGRQWSSLDWPLLWNITATAVASYRNDHKYSVRSLGLTSLSIYVRHPRYDRLSPSYLCMSFRSSTEGGSKVPSLWTEHCSRGRLRLCLCFGNQKWFPAPSFSLGWDPTCTHNLPTAAGSQWWGALDWRGAPVCSVVAPDRTPAGTWL